MLIGGLLFAGSASADFTPATWKYEKPIVLSEQLSSGEYTKIDLDQEVSFGAKRDLSDIRIVANNNTEVPYQSVILDESVRNEYVASTLRDLSTQDGSTMFIIDLHDAGRVHDHLTILSDSKNYKRSVSVASSDDALALSASDWRILTNTGYIYNFYDAKSGFNAGSGEVYYPKNTSRYLRVVIGAGEEEAVNVTGAHVYRLVEQKQREHLFTPSVVVSENEQYKTTEIVADLGGEGIPTHLIALQTSDTKNFSRRVIIEASNDGKAWSAIGDGYVFSLKTKLFSGAQLELPYHETHARYIRVLIMNEDDVPVVWSSNVFISGIVRSVVFQAEPGSSYALYFGNEDAFAPRYDLARYFQYVETTALVDGTLGAQQDNPSLTPPSVPTASFAEQNAMLFNGALVLLVALLAFLTLSYMKKLKLSHRGPKEPDHSV